MPRVPPHALALLAISHRICGFAPCEHHITADKRFEESNTCKLLTNCSIQGESITNGNIQSHRACLRPPCRCRIPGAGAGSSACRMMADNIPAGSSSFFHPLPIHRNRHTRIHDETNKMEVCIVRAHRWNSERSRDERLQLFMLHLFCYFYVWNQ